MHFLACFTYSTIYTSLYANTLRLHFHSTLTKGIGPATFWYVKAIYEICSIIVKDNNLGRLMPLVHCMIVIMYDILCNFQRIPTGRELIMNIRFILLVLRKQMYKNQNFVINIIVCPYRNLLYASLKNETLNEDLILFDCIVHYCSFLFNSWPVLSNHHYLQ